MDIRTVYGVKRVVVRAGTLKIHYLQFATYHHYPLSLLTSVEQDCSGNVYSGTVFERDAKSTLSINVPMVLYN